MRLTQAFAFAVAVALVAPAVPGAQEPMDADRKVAGGGITAAGWKGVIDPASAKQGRTINDSKFEQMGDMFHLTIGPAAIYWNPANTASGNYTVKAKFREPKISEGHPHPYGIFIGGHNPDADTRTLMYCVAYGDGTFLIRGFNGATVTTVAKRQPHAAVSKAAADGSVVNEVAWTVKGDRADCLINGTSVASFAKSEIVGPGKLESTDGIYGIRVSHNLGVEITGLSVTKQ
jgi:hypothetical protein